MVESYGLYKQAVDSFPASLKLNLNKILATSTNIQDGVFFGNAVMSFLELKKLFNSGKPPPYRFIIPSRFG